MCNVLQIVKKKKKKQQLHIVSCILCCRIFLFFPIDIVPSVLFIPYLKSRVRANTSECKAEWPTLIMGFKLINFSAQL